MNKHYLVALVCIFSLYAAPKTNPKRSSSYPAAYGQIQRLKNENEPLFEALAGYIKNQSVLSDEQKKSLESYDLAQNGVLATIAIQTARVTIKIDYDSGKYTLGDYPVVISEK